MSDDTSAQATPGTAPASTSPGPGRPRRRGRRVLVAIVVVIGLFVAGVVGAGLYLQHRVGQNIEWLDDPFASVPERPDSADGAVNVLLVGTDSRISAGDPSQWVAGAQRTDAIMLVHIPSARDGVYVMSIPRDSWVPIPGHGEAKVNAAFSFGGPSLLIHTIEQLTGVRVDHLAVTDFTSFVELTDALGGVEITIPEATFDSRRGEEIPPGTYRMDGEEALDYVRQRYGLPGGDLDRVQRQQNWMRSVVQEALSREVLTNPALLVRMLFTVTESVSADEGFSVAEMRNLGISLRNVRGGDLTFLTAPVSGLGTSADGQSIVVLDDEWMAAISEAMAQDRVTEFLDEHGEEFRTLGETVR